MSRRLSLYGQEFGRLTAIDVTVRGGKTYWRCRCLCGNEIEVAGGNLVSGNSTSCGCKNLERLRDNPPSRRHGMTETPTWNTWKSMVERCSDPKRKHYHARGISVHPRWTVFENFLADMGERPEGMTLDRIDSTGNYEPGNCRWATWITQENNRSINRLLTFDGRTMTTADWARESGISRHALFQRLKAGWSVERALTEPMKPDRRRKPRPLPRTG
jgi:hypothetical protein